MRVCTLIAAALCFIPAAACVAIDGGAVEISWAVRAHDGRAITDCGCAEPAISRVKLKLVGRGGTLAGATPCAGAARCEFPCQRQTGSTPFDIKETQPDETYEISVVALDADGAELPQVQTPAPILRTVIRGQTTELEAALLEADCRQECGGMNSTGVCTRQ